MANYTPTLTFSTGENATSVKMNQMLSNVMAIYPVGALVYMHQAPTTVETTLLSKWIQCNGAIVSRTTYATLFSQFGSADVYGGGDGSTTFGLPDLRGRYPVSVATSGHADVNALGKSDGVALATRRMAHAHTFTNPSHTHTWSDTSGAGGSHTHTYNLVASVGFCEGPGSDDNVPDQNNTTTYNTGTESANHTHTQTPSINSASALASIGPAGTVADQSAYIVAGCWYMAYV